MIDVDKLKNITHLVTHANCPDGYASALIIKDALPNVKVSFMAYGTEEHRQLELASGMLFVDFTPLRERADSFVQCGAIVLDHHPTAKDIVEEFAENGVFGLNEKNECGAWLAYEHVWAPLMASGRGAGPADLVREFAELAAIRDTWKRGDPRWEAACQQAAELIFWGFEHRSKAITAGGIPGWAVRDERLGQHLLDKQLSAAQRSLEESHGFTTGKGTRVCMFQGVSTTSDAAEIADKEAREVRCRACNYSRRSDEMEIYDKCVSCGAGKDNFERGRLLISEDGTKVSLNKMPDLVVGFHYRTDECPSCGGGGDNDPSGDQGLDPLCPKCRGSGSKLQLQFSTRSHAGYDCASFAKAHGGGGHKAAAGFTVEVSPEVSVNPYRLFELLLSEWEGGQ